MFGGICRFYSVTRTFLAYGLDEVITVRRIRLFLSFFRFIIFWVPNRCKNESAGARLRLALERLGPVWIKLGQMLSTRRDLFPSAIIDQLSILQDKVAPFDGAVAKEQIEKSIGKPIEEWCYDFDMSPLASASIAQVHTAKLKENDQEVVIKVIRPGILSVIQSDMKLIYFIANIVLRFSSDGRRLRPIEVVRDYEKTIINELNLLREAANATQLCQNFRDSSILYIPQVYSSYCSESVLVMERVYGTSISDIDALSRSNVDMKLLAERGVQVFFTQVFRDSFFHADMHPGNIFVNQENPNQPYYIAIDFGIVGSLDEKDKRYLAENFIAFFNRDYRKVAHLHVSSGWVPPDTHIGDLEFAIRAVCEPIFKKPLSDISFGYVLLNLFNTARQFNMEVQPQLVLLQKTLLYIEGIGRQLYPQLDLWKTAKPFLEEWIKDQVGFYSTLRRIRAKIPTWFGQIPEAPELFYESIHQCKVLNSNIDYIAQNIGTHRASRDKRLYLLCVGTVLFAGGVVMLVGQPGHNLHATLSMLLGGIVWSVGLMSKHSSVSR